MWNSLANITNAIAEQAAELAQEVGLDEQIAQAREMASNVIRIQPGNEDGSDVYVSDDDQAVIDRGANIFNINNSTANNGGSVAVQYSKGEVESLRKRLASVEAAAADALGELEDYKERLKATEASRDAARAQIKKLKESKDASSKSSTDESSNKLVEELRSQIESLRRNHDTTEEELTSLKQKMAKAKKQYTALKQQLAEAVCAKDAALEKAESNDENERLKKDLELAVEATREAEQRAQSALDELVKFKMSQKRNKEDEVDITDKINELQGLVSSLTEEKKVWESTKTMLEEELSRVREELRKSIIDLSVTRNDDESQKEEHSKAELIRQLRAEMEAIQSGAKAESQLANAALKNAEQRAEEALAKVEELRSQVAAAQVAHQEAVAARTAAFANIEKERTKASDLAAQAEEWHAQVQSLTIQLEQQDAASKESLVELERKIRQEASEAAEERIQSAIKETREEIEKKTTESIENLEKQLEEARNKCQAAETALEAATAAQTDRATEAALLTSLQGRIKDLEDQIEGTTQEYTKLVSENEKLRQDAAERQKRFMAVQSSFDVRKQEFLAEIESLQASLAAAEYRTREAEDIATNAKHQVEAELKRAHQAVVQALEEQLTSLSNALMEAESLNEHLHSKIVQLEESIAVANDNEKNYNRQSIELSTRIESLEQELAGALRRAESAEASKVELSLKLEQQQQQLAYYYVELERKNENKSKTDVVGDVGLPNHTGSGNNKDDAQGAHLKHNDVSQIHEMTAEINGKEKVESEEDTSAMADDIQRLTISLNEEKEKVKKLAWQVKMLTNGSGSDVVLATSGAATLRQVVPDTRGGRLQQLGGMLDMLGCAINYNRR